MLLAASALLLCYLRRNGFKITNMKSSVRTGAAMRNQSTSMTSFAWNFSDLKPPIYSDLHDPQAMALPITVDRSKQPPPPLSPDSHMLYISDEEEGNQTSRLDSRSVKKKSDTSGQYSALQYMLSSGASLLGSMLEKSTMFNLKAKRRSSSLKSGINMDILMVPLESPVHVSTLDARASPKVSLPTNLSRSSTLLCENSCDQQFTWDTVGLSIQSNHITQKETGFVISDLKKKPYDPEERATIRNKVQIQNPDYTLPKAWFVSIRDRPVSDGVQLEKKELNNVASLDSGVDTAEGLLRPGSGGYNSVPKVLTDGTENYVLPNTPKEHSNASNSQEEMQAVEGANEERHNLYITHQEAARKLNPGYSGRSLWEKREERPLIGVN
ncbi:uncharacterized protein LOC130357677 [Hyla sarda]|uniref:uncharacterized protein LOC130357677 n=1 Tax=Hyla sarda TaxID=327740 RepID=UPI0024C3795A|nr:uncharacterized protein LOC130357677 [Hyla sarda]